MNPENAKRVGIVGAGQLGRMLALSGYPLGLRFVFLDKSKDAPGGQVGEIILGEFSDPEKLRELSERVDVVTFDVENIPVEAVNAGVTKPFRPTVALLEKAQDRLLEKELFRTLDIPTPAFAPVGAIEELRAAVAQIGLPAVLLEKAQDRLLEKELFRTLDIPTPAFAPVGTIEELRAAVAQIGLPAVLKTRRLGYDGKGQRVLREEKDLEPAFDALGNVPLILESFVDYDREVSIIGVRSVSGEARFYPLSENTHRDGILRYSVAPYEDRKLQGMAERHLERLMNRFDYSGVLTIEFFESGGKLIANEIAPRVHNSGHWTIEGAITSQFENHIRAILDLPLGDTSANGYAAMVNFIGEIPELEDVLEIPGAHFHGYGKEARPGRKLGHATLTSQSRTELLARLEHLLNLEQKD